MVKPYCERCGRHCASCRCEHPASVTLILSALLVVVIFLAAMFCGSTANGQTLDERFQKSLQAITSQPAESQPPAAAISSEIVTIAPDGHILGTRIEDLWMGPVQPRPPLVPVPDPAFQRPLASIEYLPQASGAAVVADRLPRGVLLVAKFCNPCERMKAENATLIGGPADPIELVNVSTDADRFLELGLRMDSVACPVLVILDKSGRVHGLAADGKSFGCSLAGYHSAADVLAYLRKPEHGVNTAADSGEYSATAAAVVVSNADATVDTLAAALAWHLVQQSEPDGPLGAFADSGPTFGAMLEVSATVPDGLLDVGRRLIDGRAEFPAAGISLDWSGPARTFTIERGRLTIKPAVNVTLEKWRLKKSCVLDAIAFDDALSSVTLELSGMLDLKVNLR